MTQNRLSVEHFITVEQTYGSSEYINEYILLSTILCNESAFHKDGDEFTFIGDQVDVALADMHSIWINPFYTSIKN